MRKTYRQPHPGPSPILAPSACSEAAFQLQPLPLVFAWATLQVCPRLALHLAGPDLLAWTQNWLIIRTNVEIVALCCPWLLSPDLFCLSVLSTVGLYPLSARTLPCLAVTSGSWLPFHCRAAHSLLSDTKDKGLVHQRLWKSSNVCHYLLLQITAMYLQDRLMKVLMCSKTTQLFGILPCMCSLPHFPVATWQA